MRLRRRIVQATTLGVVLLLCTASAALASRAILLGTGPTAESITTSSFTATALGVSVSCPITLSGSFDEAFHKTAEKLIGEVISSRLGSCTGGELRLLTETQPWYLAYVSFQGTLPNITGVTLDVKDVAALATIVILGLTVRCLYAGPARVILNGPEARQLRFEEATTIPLRTTLSGFCPESATLRGTGTLSTTLRMTLLETLGGQITFSPPLFPNTDAGRQSVQNLVISNATNAPYRVARVGISGTGRDAFSMSTAGIEVPAGRELRVPVTFRPPSPRTTYNATIDFYELRGRILISIDIRGTSN
jgi:hypothetical protein